MSLILVVDDLAAVRERVAASLRLAGYRTECAAGGLQALQAVSRETPDLILLDVSMPVMDGMECLAVLRASPVTSRIPVILLTGETDRHSVVLAAKLRVSAYLIMSSFSLPELLKRVKQHAPEIAGDPATPGAAVPTPPGDTRPNRDREAA
jgi:CheY-like chemotaxis protein